MKKFMIITHNDLDGIGAAVVGKVVFNKQKVDVKFCGYHNVNDEVLKALRNGNYSHVFITDISVNKETASIIEKEYKGKVSLLDHHDNLFYLDDYDWATVIPGNQDEPGNESGTSLFYKFLLEKCKFKTNEALENFVEKVRSYDTWDWSNFNNDQDAKKLNDYFGIVGFYDFMNEYVTKIMNNDTILFDNVAERLLKYEQRKIDNIVKAKDKSMKVKEIDKHKVGFVFCENYQSEIGNRLLKLHPEIVGIVLIDMGRKKLSIRSTSDREFDCGIIAKRWFNGGGRQYTAGASIPDGIFERLEEFLFNKFTSSNSYSKAKVKEPELPTEYVNEKFIRRFNINSKDELKAGMKLVSNLSGKIFEIKYIRNDDDLIIIYNEEKNKYYSFSFYKVKNRFRIVKHLKLEADYKTTTITDIDKDLVIRLNDGILGPILPLLYNIIDKRFYLYNGISIDNDYYIVIDDCGVERLISEFELMSIHILVEDETYV